MNLIDIDKIELKKEKGHMFYFTDGKEIYKFDASKSTLYKKFVTNEYFAFVPVDILTNPLDVLRKIKLEQNEEIITLPETIIIPLYATNSAGKNVVYPKSGLNQWNAGGRKRDFDEVYIPFNSVLRAMYETFFPLRDTPFEVELPNGEIMSMKICQDNGKALMSNPNKALGKWLLRDVLKLKQGTLLTYDMLLELDIDAVSFQKFGTNKYRIDFKQVGEFEKFMNKEKLPDYV